MNHSRITQVMIMKIVCLRNRKENAANNWHRTREMYLDLPSTVYWSLKWKGGCQEVMWNKRQSLSKDKLCNVLQEARRTIPEDCWTNYKKARLKEFRLYWRLKVIPNSYFEVIQTLFLPYKFMFAHRLINIGTNFPFLAVSLQ